MIESFINSSPVLRIVLRTAPVLPAAVWTLWFDKSRPLESAPAWVRLAGRIALLLVIIVFAIGILGVGINWLYNPNRTI